jgi:hypothetical protein
VYAIAPPPESLAAAVYTVVAELIPLPESVRLAVEVLENVGAVVSTLTVAVAPVETFQEASAW